MEYYLYFIPSKTGVETIMSDVKIINFSDIKKIRDEKIKKEDDFWQNIADLIQDDAGDIFIGSENNTDILWPDFFWDEYISDDITSSSPMESMSRFVIKDLRTVGLNPAENKISDDMVILTMLYHSAVIEHISSAWETSDGEENEFYRWFVKIRKELNKTKDSTQ